MRWFWQVAVVAAIFVGPLIAPHASCGQEAEKQLLTAAERTDYQADSRHAEVAALVNRLAERSPHVARVDFGRTVENRPLVAAVVADPPVDSAANLKHDERLVVLLLGNIHAGECAGKEALLMLLREVALDEDHRWLKHFVLLVAPNLNADGGERIGKSHRITQQGPENGAGLRENAQGLDLNRDFVKLECPETRALLAFINEWSPHLLIDTHTTNGSRHRYELTYDVPHNPAAARAPREYLRTQMLPRVSKELEDQGVATFFYGNFNDDHTRWTTYGHQPRYGVEYMGLRGRLAILSEAYAHISFKERVQATKAFVAACLDDLAEHRGEAAALLHEAAEQTSEAGEAPRVGDEVAIAAEIAPFEEKATVKGYGQNKDDRDVPRDYQVEHFARFQPTRKVQRPFAYVIPFNQSRIADRIRMHGIRIEQLTADVEVEAEVYHIDKFDRASDSFQGHRLASLESTSRREKRSIPAKSYIVRTAQPLANLAVYLLEPEADDGLATWSFFDHTVQQGDDFPILRIPAAADLPTRPVKRIAPAELLTVGQIHGQQERVNFSGSFPSGLRWLPKSSSYLRTIGDRTLRIDAASGAREPFYDREKMADAFAALPGIKPADAKRLAGNLGTLSPDASASLIEFRGDLYYYRFGDETARRLTSTPGEEKLVEFSPDGAMAALVRDHNLYVIDIATGAERALTTAGNADLLHGELDWVYQEELYGRGNFKGFWWSPDSSHIALLRLDQRPVHEYDVADLIPYRQTVESTRYPKAGDPLPRVALGVVSAAGGDITWVDDFEYSDAEYLISRVGWKPDSSRVVYQVQNREQTWLDLRLANPDTGGSEKLLRETSGAWVMAHDDPHWLKDGSFLWLSERDGRLKIYRTSADGKESSELTPSRWNVRTLYGIDADEKWAYCLAVTDSPTEAHAYRIGLADGKVQRLTKRAGNHSVRFNDNFTHFFDYSSTVHSPIRADLHRADGKFVRTIEPNLDDRLKYYKIRRPEFFQARTRDGAQMEALLIKPPDFDPKKKYPVLCYVYAGPHAPAVWNRWGGSTYLWHQMLAQRGYCVWICDNRSASSTGVKDTWKTFRNLGEFELRDIEDGVAWLKQQPWIDGERVGIWGWSYGGYMTSYALTHSKSFKLGVAGAPVTDWRNYDAIYTERYMGLPQDNGEGYRNSSVVAAAEKLHGRLLLIHGATDDNVHLANTLQLSYALQNAGKQFDLMIYPRNRHSVTRPAQSHHMWEMITRFVTDHL